MAIKHEAIIQIPGGFDPDVHTDNEGCCEPGDPFFKRAQYAEETDEEYAAIFVETSS